MADIDVTTLTPVNIRDVWPDEAADFTPWLGDNLHLLGQALGLGLGLVETEAPTGSFSLDVLATDTGRRCTVIIENQWAPGSCTRRPQSSGQFNQAKLRSLNAYAVNPGGGVVEQGGAFGG